MMAARTDGRGAQEIQFSIEIFPPREGEARERLAEALKGLEDLAPAYISVTYGAGGSTRERTLDMVERVRRDTAIAPAAHLTCVSASIDEVDEAVRAYWDGGIRRIVALRGDPPGGLDVPYHPHPRGYQRTADLVAGILRLADFDVSVAAYPEKHPQSPDLAADLDVLAAKADAGAARAITQFFFENGVFLDYVDKVRARAIAVPIVPGIIPVINFAQLSGFAEKCGATVPSWLAERYVGLDDIPQRRAEIGIEIATDQITGLIEAGFDAFHIYSLNRMEIVRTIIERVRASLPATAAV